MIGRGEQLGVDRRVRPQIEMAPAVVNPPAQMRHRIRVGDIHRRKRGRAALCLDPVIELFERACGFGNGDNVVSGGKRFSERKAKPA